MKQTLFDLDYLVCTLDTEAAVLFHEWKRKPTAEEFEGGLMKVYNTYQEQKPNFKKLHWLGNTKNVGVLSLKTQKWLDEVWNDTLFVKGGVKTHAVLVGTDTFGKYAMQKFATNAEEHYKNQNLKMGVFNTEAEAYSWFAKNNA
jgi:hypothetical protein